VLELLDATPVRHVGAEEDDVDGAGAVDGEEEDHDEHAPLVRADVADVLAEVALGHLSPLPSLPSASQSSRALLARRATFLHGPVIV